MLAQHGSAGNNPQTLIESGRTAGGPFKPDFGLSGVVDLAHNSRLTTPRIAKLSPAAYQAARNQELS